MAEYVTPEFHPAFEEYCMAVFELREDGVEVIQARIAERLQVSRPAVSEMVRRMEAEGLVTVERNEIRLTPAGDRLAERVRSEEHTSELQSRPHLVCRLLLEKKKK